MKCPYCNKEVTRIYNHLRKNCFIRPHYKIISLGDFKCEHNEINISYNTTIKKDEKTDIVLTIKCTKCQLHLLFYTFETIWLPNIKDLANLNKLE